jgi:hypothetical protein
MSTVTTGGKKWKLGDTNSAVMTGTWADGMIPDTSIEGSTDLDYGETYQP